jgi:hypothetical protein
VRADVGVAGSAQQAAAVHYVALCGYAVAFVHIGDEFSGFHNVAGELVSDDDRWPHPAACPVVPFEDVHVCAAHTGAADTNQNFVISYFRNRDFAENETASR